MPIGLAHYLTVAAILFTLGIFGIFLNRKNVIIIMMSIELMLLAVNINFVAFSVVLNDLVCRLLLEKKNTRLGPSVAHYRRLGPVILPPTSGLVPPCSHCSSSSSAATTPCGAAA